MHSFVIQRITWKNCLGIMFWENRISVARKIFLFFGSTTLTQIMADKFKFFWSESQDYIAEADADLIHVPGQLELHGRCRCGVLLSPRCGALYLSQI